MSAQKIASAVGLAALTALFLGVGLPSLLPPGPVPEIVVPAGETGDEPTRPPERFEGPGGDDTNEPGDPDQDDTDDPDDTGDGAGEIGSLDSSDDSPDDTP